MEKQQKKEVDSKSQRPPELVGLAKENDDKIKKMLESIQTISKESVVEKRKKIEQQMNA